jgi:hypothetical protein
MKMRSILASAIGVLLAGLLTAAAGTAATARPDPDAPMTVVIVRSSDKDCEPKCAEWIMAEGKITEETPPLIVKAFDEALRQTQKRLPVVIRSPGGNILAALQIGYYLHSQGADVAVGTTIYDRCSPARRDCKPAAEDGGRYRGRLSSERAFCFSACPLILAAGTQRIASPRAQIGVHHWAYDPEPGKEGAKPPPSKEELASRDKLVERTIADFLTTVAISEDMIADMKRASFSSMYLLTPKRRRELALVTDTKGVDRVAGPGVCSVSPPAENCILVGDSEYYRSALRRSRIDPDAAAMSVVLVRDSRPGCEPVCAQWIAARGVIAPQTPKLFARVLERAGEASLPVLIDSPGGDLDAALEIGRMIAKRGLAVAVSDVDYRGCAVGDGPCVPPSKRAIVYGFPSGTGDGCGGVCILVLRAGMSRSLQDEANLTLLNPAVFVSRKSPFNSKTRIREYLDEMGAGPDLFETMEGLRELDVGALTEREARALGLLSDADPRSPFTEGSACRDKPRPAHCVTARK